MTKTFITVAKRFDQTLQYQYELNIYSIFMKGCEVILKLGTVCFQIAYKKYEIKKWKG